MLVASGGVSGFVLPFTQSYKLKYCAFLDQLMGGSWPHAEGSICGLHIVLQLLVLFRLSLQCLQIKLLEIKYESSCGLFNVLK